MSTSRSGGKLNDFDHWLATEFATRGAFTMLVILVDIGERKRNIMQRQDRRFMSCT